MNRELINSQIDSATWEDTLTQYIAFEKVRRVLAKYQIFIPRTVLGQEEGYIILPLSQFTEILGASPDGTINTGPHTESAEFKLYFEWAKNDSHDGYVIFSEIVNDEELKEILEDVEQERT